jgi:hypothetical protein
MGCIDRPMYTQKGIIALLRGKHENKNGDKSQMIEQMEAGGQ